MKRSLLAIALLSMSYTAYAQNKISISNYKVSAPQKIEQVGPVFGPGFASSSSLHVKTQASLCSGKEYNKTEPLDSYAHLAQGVGALGWTYGTQDCWLFVNVDHAPAAARSVDFYFFEAVDKLQKDGLLPNPMIKYEMPGAQELAIPNDSAYKVIAFRLDTLKF